MALILGKHIKHVGYLEILGPLWAPLLHQLLNKGWPVPRKLCYGAGDAVQTCLSGHKTLSTSAKRLPHLPCF